MELHQLCWSASKLGEALSELSLRSEMLKHGGEFLTIGVPPVLHDEQALTAWIRNVALHVGIEVEPAETNYGELGRFLLKAGPALVGITTAEGLSFIALLRGRRKSVVVLGPDLCVHKVPLNLITDVISGPIESYAKIKVQRMLELGAMRNLGELERNCIRRALLTDQIGSASINCIWLLRLSPGTPFLAQIRQFGLFKSISALLGVYSVQYCLGIIAWWILAGCGKKAS
jgi:hypothetical protein